MPTRNVAAKLGAADPDVSAIIRAAGLKPAPVDHFTEIADELHRAADAVASLAGSGHPQPRHFNLNIQPGNRESDDEATAASVDAMANALLGISGHPHEVGGGSYHYGTGQTQRGPISVTIYQSIGAEYALRIEYDRQLAEREAELEKLRAELEGLRRSRSHPKWAADVDAAKFSDNGWTRAGAQAYEDDDVDRDDVLTPDGSEPVPADVEGYANEERAGEIRQVSAPPADSGTQ